MKNFVIFIALSLVSQQLLAVDMPTAPNAATIKSSLQKAFESKNLPYEKDSLVVAYNESVFAPGNGTLTYVTREGGLRIRNRCIFEWADGNVLAVNRCKTEVVTPSIEGSYQILN